MSDYSPPPSPNAFDDLEDVLYDADPAPDLADELASHALHSPLLYAAEFEPGYDLQEYYSDWEYYSDDYYDDDPSILRTNPVDGSPIKTGRSKQESAKSNRSRKRKLAERDSDVPPLEGDRQYLEACMKGTVWAQPVPVRDNVYQIGQGEKVALLKDWRTKFGTGSPKKGQRQATTKPSLPNDESWANDLSLADMGLLNARGSIAQPEEEEGDQGVDEQDEGEELEDLDEDDGMAEDDAAGDEMLQERANIEGGNKPVSPATHSRQASAELVEPEFEEQPSKRRKRGRAAPEPVLPSPPATNGSAASHSTRRTRQRANSASTTASIPASKSNKQERPPAVPENKTSRKRKASPAEEDTEMPPLPKSRATAPTTSSRAKRVASTTNNVVSDKTKPTAATSGPVRATRSKKK